jgi:hypothetical protein
MERPLPPCVAESIFGLQGVPEEHGKLGRNSEDWTPPASTRSIGERRSRSGGLFMSGQKSMIPKHLGGATLTL